MQISGNDRFKTVKLEVSNELYNFPQRRIISILNYICWLPVNRFAASLPVQSNSLIAENKTRIAFTTSIMHGDQMNFTCMYHFFSHFEHSSLVALWGSEPSRNKYFARLVVLKNLRTSLDLRKHRRLKFYEGWNVISIDDRVTSDLRLLRVLHKRQTALSERSLRVVVIWCCMRNKILMPANDKYRNILTFDQ